MVFNVDKLIKQYDKEIREKCELKRKQIYKCIQDNKENKHICNNWIDSFQKCIKDFDEDFKEDNKLIFKFKNITTTF